MFSLMFSSFLVHLGKKGLPNRSLLLAKGALRGATFSVSFGFEKFKGNIRFFIALTLLRLFEE